MALQPLYLVLAVLTFLILSLVGKSTRHEAFIYAQNTNMINAHKDIDVTSLIRTHDYCIERTKTVHALDRTAAVTGRKILLDGLYTGSDFSMSARDEKYIQYYGQKRGGRNRFEDQGID
jgi:hypothetical protein